MTDTCLFHSNSRSQFSVEVTSDDMHVFVLFDDTTDHIDAAMTRSLTHSTQFTFCLHLLCKMIATPCLFVNFPDSITMCPWFDSHTSSFDLHVSETNISSHFRTCTSWNNSSILWLEFIDHVFFCRTVNVTSLRSFLASVGCRAMMLLLLRWTSFLSYSSVFLSFLVLKHVGTSPSTCLSPFVSPPSL